MDASRVPSTDRPASVVGSHVESAGDAEPPRSLSIGLTPESVRPRRIHRRWWQKLTKWLNDSSALMDETRESDKRPVLVLHPEGKARVAWDLLLALLMIYLSIVLPFRTGVLSKAEEEDYREKYVPLVVMDTISDVAFLMDIMVNFRTAFYDIAAQRFHYDTMPMAEQYVFRGTFAMDATASSPFLLGFLVDNVDDDLRLTKLFRLLRLLRVSHIARVLRDSRNGSRMQKWLVTVIGDGSFHRSAWRFSTWFAVILVFTHWWACFLVMVANPSNLDGDPDCLEDAEVSEYDSECSWLTLEDGNEDVYIRYVRAFHWAVQTLTTVGYGNLPIRTTRELLFSCFAMFAGISTYATALSLATSALRKKDERDQELREKMAIINTFIEDNKLSSGVAASVRRHFEHEHWLEITERTTRLDYNRVELLSSMPEHLQSRVLRSFNKSLLRQVDGLKQVTDPALFELVVSGEPLRVPRGHVVARERAVAHCMHFIMRGKLIAMVDGKRMHGIDVGDTFGLLSCLPLRQALQIYRHRKLTDANLGPEGGAGLQRSVESGGGSFDALSQTSSTAYPKAGPFHFEEASSTADDGALGSLSRAYAASVGSSPSYLGSRTADANGEKRRPRRRASAHRRDRMALVEDASEFLDLEKDYDLKMRSLVDAIIETLQDPEDNHAEEHAVSIVAESQCELLRLDRRALLHIAQRFDEFLVCLCHSAAANVKPLRDYLRQQESDRLHGKVSSLRLKNKQKSFFQKALDLGKAESDDPEAKEEPMGSPPQPPLHHSQSTAAIFYQPDDAASDGAERAPHNDATEHLYESAAAEAKGGRSVGTPLDAGAAASPASPASGERPLHGWHHSPLSAEGAGAGASVLDSSAGALDSSAGVATIAGIAGIAARAPASTWRGDDAPASFRGGAGRSNLRRELAALLTSPPVLDALVDALVPLVEGARRPTHLQEEQAGDQV